MGNVVWKNEHQRSSLLMWSVPSWWRQNSVSLECFGSWLWILFKYLGALYVVQNSTDPNHKWQAINKFNINEHKKKTSEKKQNQLSERSFSWLPTQGEVQLYVKFAFHEYKKCHIVKNVLYNTIMLFWSRSENHPDWQFISILSLEIWKTITFIFSCTGLLCITTSLPWKCQDMSFHYVKRKWY